MHGPPGAHCHSQLHLPSEVGPCFASKGPTASSFRPSNCPPVSLPNLPRIFFLTQLSVLRDQASRSLRRDCTPVGEKKKGHPRPSHLSAPPPRGPPLISIHVHHLHRKELFLCFKDAYSGCHCWLKCDTLRLCFSTSPRPPPPQIYNRELYALATFFSSLSPEPRASRSTIIIYTVSHRADSTESRKSATNLQATSRRDPATRNLRDLDPSRLTTIGQHPITSRPELIEQHFKLNRRVFFHHHGVLVAETSPGRSSRGALVRCKQQSTSEPRHRS